MPNALNFSYCGLQNPAGTPLA